jgi:hypothetical protein
VDLLECLTCRQRFLIADAGDGCGWPCPSDQAELSLVVSDLPGKMEQIAGALNAQLLSAGTRSGRKLGDRNRGQARRRNERQAERISREYLTGLQYRGKEV